MLIFNGGCLGIVEALKCGELVELCQVFFGTILAGSVEKSYVKFFSSYGHGVMSSFLKCPDIRCFRVVWSYVKFSGVMSSFFERLRFCGDRTQKALIPGILVRVPIQGDINLLWRVD